MWRKFYPKQRKESAYQVDYEAFARSGYRGILFDIDNTLVPHGAPATPEAIALFQRLRRLGFRTCLLSNNHEPRVRPFAEAVGSEFLCDAHKPSVRGYEAAMERIGTSKKDTLLIGDQLFTDVYGANRAGLTSILVNPIHPKEEIQIVLKRKLERIVLYFYCRQEKNS
ncbi:YqeG family HAD IIIA-type phosphatase [Hominifimenecus sp. rT4P-3]|uniref:YqeG family HAD IIIA-type phosphatase n=1 Tax=Hominifimenecus sp. rT4P-3 TaxID=3242979 RepID=UPI003DA60D1B